MGPANVMKRLHLFWQRFWCCGFKALEARTAPSYHSAAPRKRTETPRTENGNQVVQTNSKQETKGSNIKIIKQRKRETAIESKEGNTKRSRKREKIKHKNMSESQSAISDPSRDDDAIVLSQFEIQRLESIKTDRSRSDPPSQTTTPKTLTPTTPDIFFKTKLCANFTTKGSCGYGDGCTFAHGMEELRSLWDARFRVCNMYLKSGRCTYGSNCTYLHVEKTGEGFCASGADRKGPGPGFYKTNPCFNWRTNGRCSYGACCRFIHGGEEAKVEAEGGHKIGVLEGSSRSRSIYSFKPIVLPSRQKKGSEKLKEFKKINGIYGDWPEENCQIDNCF